jgi:hypothetical protein
MEMVVPFSLACSGQQISVPAAFHFHMGVIFLIIDVEGWCENSEMVAEVGATTLDTAELQEVCSRHNGENWCSKPVTRHLAVAENKAGIHSRSGVPNRDVGYFKS